MSGRGRLRRPRPGGSPGARPRLCGAALPLPRTARFRLVRVAGLPLLLVPVLPLLAATALVGQEPAAREAGCDPAGGFRTEARVTGQVTRAGSAVAVDGAIVELRALSPAGDAVLDRARTRSDSLGRFSLCGLPAPARFEVMARTEGAASDVLAFDWEGGADLEIALEVRPGAAGRGLEERVAELRERAGGNAGRIVGRVRDRATGRPVTSATVALGGGMGSAASDGRGRFALPDVLPGRHQLTVRHLGYAEVSETVEVPAGRTLQVDVDLSADPVELEPLVVTTVRSRRLEMHGFYERKMWGERLGLGHFFTREEIEELRPGRITDILRTVPGVRFEGCGHRGCRIIKFGRSSRTCYQADQYVDGVLVRDSEGDRRGLEMLLNEYVVPSEVAAVEVYQGGASLPAGFGGSSGQCGAVVIWTRGGG